MSVEDDIFTGPPSAGAAAAAAPGPATYGGGRAGAVRGAALGPAAGRKRGAPAAAAAGDGRSGGAPACSPSKRVKKRSVQLTLDLGQRSRGLVWCDRCALRYNEASAEDAAAHAAAHRRAVRPLQYTRLGGEEVVPPAGGGRPLPSQDRVLVLRVGAGAAGAPPLLARVFARMGEDLGGDVAAAVTEAGSAVYLYITRVETGAEAVGGCAVVEPLARAACFVSRARGVGDGEGEGEGAERGGRGGAHAGGGGGPRRADMGVLYVWVDAVLRLRGIGTALLDAARRSFVYGADVPLSRVAFSQPTEDGKRFAASYTRSREVLVYKKELPGRGAPREG